MPKASVSRAAPASGGAGNFMQLTWVAEAIVSRIAQLLRAPVALIGEANELLAVGSSEHGRPTGDLVRHIENTARLRVPFQIDHQPVEIVVGEALDGEVISPRLAQVLVELVISQITTLAQDRQNKYPESKDRLIYNLLHGLFDDEAAIQREARRLGIDLTAPRAVILIDAASYLLESVDRMPDAPQSDVRRRGQIVIGSVVSFFYLPNDTICAYIGDGEIAVLKASNTRNLERWAGDRDLADLPNASWANLGALKRAGSALLRQLRTDLESPVNIGIGRYHPGLRGLARSYQDARAALVLGRRFQGTNQVHCLDGLGVAAFVGVPDEQTKVELSTYLLSPLDHEAELLQTLAVFFAQNCSPSATASHLSIHRNTLTHRLDKVSSLTGLDPRRFDDAVQIRLALLLRELASESQ